MPRPHTRRLTRIALAATITTTIAIGGAWTAPPSASAATDPDLCYIVADSGGANGGNDQLASFDRVTETFTLIGTGTGTNNVETADLWPATDTLYAIDADELGTIDLTTGVYTTLGGPFGTADGAAGPQSIVDADGMAFDPFSFVIWATERKPGGPDYLFKIDPTTGSVIADAFGPGVDYVVSTPVDPGSADLDDLAISTVTGEIFAIANAGAPVASQRLVTLDPATGDQTLVGAVGVADLEGLTFAPTGQLYATDGSGEIFYDIDPATGAASNPRTIGVASDYESVTCLTGGVNRIEGTVFADVDADGVLDPAEVGFGGATLLLVRDVDGDGVADPGEPVLATTETDADGEYGFDVSATGDFVVAVDETTLPADTLTTTPTERSVSFPGLGLIETDVDFGYVDVDEQPATVGDRVWLDSDGDGVQDGGESGVADVTVELLDGSGAVIETATTDADGRYSFDVTAGQSYRIRVVAPDGAVFTARDAGSDDAVDSDVAADGTTATIVPAPGENFDVGDAGIEVEATVGPEPATVGDRVWLDLDGDGVQDDGEPGVAGVTVELRDDDGAVAATTTTGAAGGYTFDVEPGDAYRIVVVAPTGATFTGRDVGADTADSDVGSNGSTATFTATPGFAPDVGDAGILPASLTGIVYTDRDRDGTLDPGETPAIGVTVRLIDGSGNVLGTTVTGSDGRYAFDGLVPGTGYRIEVVDQGNGFAPVGGTSDVDPTGSVTIALSSGINSDDSDAGLLPPPLPATGGSTTTTVVLALALIGAGASLMATAARRRLRRT